MLRHLGLDPALDLVRAGHSVRLERHVRPGVFLGAERVLDADEAGVGDGGVG